jgi:murein DD-endopeptidase MepM/ murein hydrolase activator NlpD
MSPALLLAQTATGQTTTQSKPDDSKPANTQAAGGNASAAATQSTQKSATAPAQTAEKAKPNPTVPYPIMSEAAKQRARQLYDYFAHAQFKPLYENFSPEMKKNLPEAKLTEASKQMGTQLGSPTETIAESFIPDMLQPATLYMRTMKYTKGKVPVTTAVGVNEQGELTAMNFQPTPDTPRDPYADYQDTARLRLPFDGSWTVIQGGRNIYENGFAASDEERYTVWFVFTKDGRPFDGDGKRNFDFYCYGQPVLAPAAGKVMQVTNTMPDHPPGHPTDVPSQGNKIVIAHGNQEYSLIPYLKQGSIKVKPGQHVKQGDVIGQCGDTGSSIAPHVEYRLQNTPGFPTPATLPAQFVDYTADGKEVKIGEPLRGQIVANQTKTPEVETAAKPQ